MLAEDAKEKEEELIKLRDAVSKRDIEVCKTRSAYIDVLEKIDELQRENRLIKKENEALKEINGETNNCYGDEERDEILDESMDVIKENILLKCGKCEFIARNEAGLKTHFTVKHKNK